MHGLFNFGRRDNEARRDDEQPPDADRWPQPRRDATRNRPLELEARINRLANGWSIRLPVRAEHVTVERRTVAVEEVGIARRPRRDLEQLEATVRHEQLVVDTTDDLDVSRRERVGDGREPER